MRSFQNLLVLQNLYRLKALGFHYSDPIVINHKSDGDLPDDTTLLSELIRECHLCDLSKSRAQSMSGFGSTESNLMIVDAFVSVADDTNNSYYGGRSGEMLQKMIQNVLRLPLDQVYYTHGVKCKPLGTKHPSNSEIQSCKPYLFKQIELVNPGVIIALGADAYAMLTDDATAFDKIRGQQIAFGERSIVPIYHPSYLLRNPSQKQVTMHDLEMIKGLL